MTKQDAPPAAPQPAFVPDAAQGEATVHAAEIHAVRQRCPYLTIADAVELVLAIKEASPAVPAQPPVAPHAAVPAPAQSVAASVTSNAAPSSLSAVSSVADLLPAHEASLAITHNDHKDLYQTVERWLAEQQEGDNCWFDWISLEERQRAIETDSVWTIQWYPNTPVGFNALAASTLDALLKAVPSTTEGQKP